MEDSKSSFLDRETNLLWESKDRLAQDEHEDKIDNKDVEEMRFTKLGRDLRKLPFNARNWLTVLDNETNLFWEVKTEDGSIHDKNKRFNWFNAHDKFLQGLNTENFGSFCDWRLPSRMELESILDLTRCCPSINLEYFPNTESSSYFSSTPFANSKGVWNVNFGYGDVYSIGKSYSCYVRAVRGGRNN